MLIGRPWSTRHTLRVHRGPLHSLLFHPGFLPRTIIIQFLLIPRSPNWNLHSLSCSSGYFFLIWRSAILVNDPPLALPPRSDSSEYPTDSEDD